MPDLTRWPAPGGATLAAALLLSGAAAAQQPARNGLTDVPGIRVGHHTLAERPTGCTVVLLDSAGAVGGISQRGAAPGTRETDLLDPLNMVERVNAIVLTGGSAFGLDAAQGTVRWLEERNIGFPTGAGVVPIVPAAVIFDLPFGNRPGVRPTADCGYRAASAATNGRVAEGNVGAGAGATVGKLFAFFQDPRRGDRRWMPMKAGVGTASITLPNGLVVAALVVVNAVGDVIDPTTGKVVAGMRNADGTLADARALLRSGAILSPRPGENTTLGIVATNARLTKTQVSRVALMADDGLARAIAPSHTEGDGDTMFALATGAWAGTASVTLIGSLAADVVAEAIVRAAARADSSGGLASARQTGTIPARHR
ncbi:MAG TPA: P1 family peptidase [Gemmatimonadaceae bacterium]|nr:P1 family peptidase [Gemmatimonadaceae bacterium]